MSRKPDGPQGIPLRSIKPNCKVAEIRLPSGRTVQAEIGGFRYTAVHRTVAFEEQGLWTLFNLVITWRQNESPEHWSATMEVGRHDERTCADGVGIYEPLETFDTAWRVLRRPITDPDEIAVAVVQMYLRLRPGRPRAPVDEWALGHAIGSAWAAGLLYAIGFDGKLVEHGDLDRLALEVLDSVPGFAINEEQPSANLVAGVRDALEEAHGSGLIQLSGADYVQ